MKKISVFIMMTMLSTSAFLSISDAAPSVVRKVNISNISETMNVSNTQSELQEIGYDCIGIEKAKKGVIEYTELGLYWDRGSVQHVLYPDIQEICEEAFGDYMSPLQGLTEILHSYRKRYRTDKESAIVCMGRVQFYVFLDKEVALATIEERTETYYTTFRILRKEETKGIRVLDIPPMGGIGIAGINNKPEKPNYDTHRAVTSEGESEYSKADIQMVFNDDLQGMMDGIFGNYVEVLQGLYMLTEQEGYGNYLFVVEDMPAYIRYGNYETSVIKDNYCEFTMTLGFPRARVTIRKDGEQYYTTFRLIKDEEFETVGRAG